MVLPQTDTHAVNRLYVFKKSPFVIVHMCSRAVVSDGGRNSNECELDHLALQFIEGDNVDATFEGAITNGGHT